MRKHKQRRLHSAEPTVRARIGPLSRARGSWQHLPALRGLRLADTGRQRLQQAQRFPSPHTGTKVHSPPESFCFLRWFYWLGWGTWGGLLGFSFHFFSFYFLFIFVCCRFLILFLILDAVTGFCSTSLHEQAAPLRDFTAFKGHRTATMVKCLV